MDPLTAFSLACGVIQVIDFSTELAKRCRQFYKDGTLSQNKEAEEMARHLTQLRTSLNLPNHPDQDELLNLSEKCSATAEDLVAELQKLKVTGPHRKRQVIEKTIKTMWKKTAIDDIQKRLDDYRKLLDHRILTELRNRFDLLSIQQSEAFQSLDLKVRMIITDLAQGPKTFEELKALMQNEARSVKVHVTNELQHHQRDLAHKEYCQRFLESLWFPEIYRRQENIHEAHEKTFQWIYEPDKTTQWWDNFVYWLQNGQHTYWIHGKAGSGKSTLMNYIYQDDRTAASLKAWSGSKELLMPGFFFWNAGQALEKSSEGLLRSLIYQLLKKFPSLTPSSQIILPSEPGQTDPCSYEPIAAWTERRLQATFESVLRRAQELCRICIFIDGLDEFIGDQDILIGLIAKVQTADVKVCLSSRPYRSYSVAFGLSDKLQLQDLTKSDIEKYVSDKLHPFAKAESARNIKDLLDNIVYKAEGVFLWVELVVKDLIKGLKNDDTLEQLQERVVSMPSDIEHLYGHMLSQIDKVYRTQAAELFRMGLSDLTGSLFTLALAIFGRFNKRSDIGLSDTIFDCEEAKNKIPIICAGLLEVRWPVPGKLCQWIRSYRQRMEGGRFRGGDTSLSFNFVYGESSELAEVKFIQRNAQVDFIHRTARDYLEQSKQGNQFLEANTPPGFNAHISHVNALLTKATLLGVSLVGCIYDHTYHHVVDDEQDLHASGIVNEIMQHVCLAERQVGTAQVSLCDDIDCTMTAIDRRHGLPTPKVLREIMENISVTERRNGTARIAICAEYDNILADLNWSSSSEAHWSVRWCIWRSPYRNDLASRPVDFLGFAALWGLFPYVRQALDRTNQTIDQDRTNCLLRLSMWGARFHSRNVGFGDKLLRYCVFTAEVLKMGGDCNIYVKEFSSTPWGDFLTQIPWMLCAARSTELSDIKRACAMTTKVFLENGADVNLRTHRELTVSLFGLWSFLRGQKTNQTLICREENSALFEIRKYFGGTSELKSLESHILKNGGSSSSRWTHISFDRPRFYEVSERQNLDLKACLRGYNDDESDGWIQIRQKWALQIAKLFEEIRGDTGHADQIGPWVDGEFVRDYGDDDNLGSSNEEVLSDDRDADRLGRSNAELSSTSFINSGSRVKIEL